MSNTAFSLLQRSATINVMIVAAALLLNPLALGPSTAVWPNLFGLLAAGLVLGVAAFSNALRSPSRAAPWLLGLAFYVGLHSAFVQGFTVMSTLFIFTAFAMLALGGALQCLEPRVTVPALAYGVLAAAVLNVVIGWLQYLGLAAPFAPWLNMLADPGVIYGNVRQPNQYATLMAMGVGAVWWSAAVKRPSPQPSPASGRGGEANSFLFSPASAGERVRALILSFILLIILTSGIVLSGSRTGMLETLLIAAMAFCWRGEKGSTQRKLALLFMALPLIYLVEWQVVKLVSQALGLADIRGGVERFSDSTGGHRTELWHNVIHLIADKPLFGHGVHELGFAHFQFDFSQLSWWPGQGRSTIFLDNAHNIVLQSWVELGLVGMLLSVGAFAYSVWRAKPWREASADRQMAWLIIAPLALHSLLEYPLHYAQFWLPFCLALGIAFMRYDLHTHNSNIPLVEINYSKSDVPLTSIWIIRIVAMCCIAAFAYAAWDYDRVSQAYNGPQRRAIPLGVDRVADAQKSWLFAPYARFAKLMVTPVEPYNAQALLPELREMLHFSAEPRVLDKLLRALKITGANDAAVQKEIAFIEQRYAAAFPAEFKQYRLNP
jgi:O-antigen ligase